MPDTKNAFGRVLDNIRDRSVSETEKGRLFEALILKFFERDPHYATLFERILPYREWAHRRTGRGGQDKGIDLVAQMHDGGVCAIQCKCYAPGKSVAKPDIDSFIAESARSPFTWRVLVHTGRDLGRHALSTIDGLEPACHVIDFSELARARIAWAAVDADDPESVTAKERFAPRPHQIQARDDVLAGFEKEPRGKLIMACGTGKTFTALLIAERLAGATGRVLYVVPSISLLQQTMREWSEQGALSHRYIGICSDPKAGRTEDRITDLGELEIPVTTEPKAITAALRKRPNAMTVAFCTYQSIRLVEEAQNAGAPRFDLMVCDEAHRTTGIEKPGDRTSHFVLVHDKDRIRARKRLYMTATPRLYTDAAQSKAANEGIGVFSMDKEKVYGPEFHRLPFSRAIEMDLLSDYKVVVFAIDEAKLDAADGEISLSDRARIVGSWRALNDPEDNKTVKPLRRAIAFTNRIKDSKLIADKGDDVIALAAELMPDGEPAVLTETRHVDGQQHALTRRELLDWLRNDDEGDVCRILSNARCLSEGIDVPALDAVLFLQPKSSHVDIVQAVGRVMRTSDDKEYGYIVLPVAVPPGTDPANMLDKNAQFKAIWAILRALRSHDERLDAEINQFTLNRKPSDRIRIAGAGGEGRLTEGVLQSMMPLDPLALDPTAIHAKIVEKVGDRLYWKKWAGDVADVFERLNHRIAQALDAPGHEELNEWFESFRDALTKLLNDSVDREAAIEMLAQHMLTRPVFEALFEGYDFASRNPVAKSLDDLHDDIREFESELEGNRDFYDDIKRRVSGIDSPEARTALLNDLYETFFKVGMPKVAQRLGIVYTPVEIVDFILHSTDHLLREELGVGLTDQDVHVLDPFSGTGTFTARLLASGLICDEDLERKYRKELHTTETVLLAYYIGTIAVEEAYRGRRGKGYEPFNGAVLADTFNMNKEKPKLWMEENSARAKRQQRSPIQVIVGNPPWSAWQKKADDDNQRPPYPEMEDRIRSTYAALSTATLKNALYDTYKMAIRWATDRIGDCGVVAFVTSGSWIVSNVDSGVRASLADEFNSIYVLNLRGGIKGLVGDAVKREGGNPFNVQVPVTITLLVRNTNTMRKSCRILYHDIGDYLNREEKLAFLSETRSIAHIGGWRNIVPDSHSDWVGQRSEAYGRLRPMASKEAKDGAVKMRPVEDGAIFVLYSNGLKTGRDVYLYNISANTCAANARLVVDDYQSAMQVREEQPEYGVDGAAKKFGSHLKWDKTLKDNLKNNREVLYSPENIWTTQYRPFVKLYCYVEYALVQRKGQMDLIFPDADSDNRAIYVPGIGGAARPFSALMVDLMPDLHVISGGHCFPRYRYVQPVGVDLLAKADNMERVDNISDTALQAFRSHYGIRSITKDQIFDYIYGLLHSPDYRKRFASDLRKELPRIPMAPDFHSYAKAGRRLSALHLDYEVCKMYPLRVESTKGTLSTVLAARIEGRRMDFADKATKSVMTVDHRIQLAGIPPEAHRYEVNGRTPLEWFIDRYRITQDKHSGIVNDPNGWFDNVGELVKAIRRIVHVSVETVRIVDSLPPPFDDGSVN